MHFGRMSAKLHRMVIGIAALHVPLVVLMLLGAGYLFGFLVSCFVGAVIFVSFLIGYGWRLKAEPASAKMATALHYAHAASQSEHEAV